MHLQANFSFIFLGGVFLNLTEKSLFHPDIQQTLQEFYGNFANWKCNTKESYNVHSSSH